MATGIILAGGQNRRMGSNKAVLSLDGKVLIEHISDMFKQLFEEVVVVTNDPDAFQLKGCILTGDIIRGKGPLGGLHAGLNASSSSYNFAVACDMPLLVPALIEYLVAQSPGYDVTVPKVGPYLEPLHAVYHRSCLPAVEKALAEGSRKVSSFYRWVKVKCVSEEQLSPLADLNKAFYNVNTPEDWLRARRWLKEEGQK